MRLEGLPPQVRGAPPVDSLCVGLVGWAYPRRCGEHLRRPPWGAGRGLPPQVRGAHRCRCRVPPHAGLTPAGAGSTSRGRAGSPGARLGLPPQVRGALRGRQMGRFAAISCWAYPRRCGEHVIWRQFGTPGGPYGLPPQVRGAPPRFSKSNHIPGLTPAGAGSTTRLRTAAVHSSSMGLPPQVRGAQQGRFDNSRCRMGLPPQVRGAPYDETRRVVRSRNDRLTPAGAGSTPGRQPLAAQSVSSGLTPAGAGSTANSRSWLHGSLLSCGLPPQVRGALHNLRYSSSLEA